MQVGGGLVHMTEKIFVKGLRRSAEWAIPTIRGTSFIKIRITLPWPEQYLIPR